MVEAPPVRLAARHALCLAPRHQGRPGTAGPEKDSRAFIAADRPVVATIDERLDVEMAVAQLPARQRLAVDCYYFVGLTVDQTAAVMGCAAGTVKSSLSDARDRLRKLLEPQ